MYTTCIFCHAPLGSNEALEHFPVGRRLAFDAEKGRLWAVCRVCKQWNLTPLEERWEAIEDAERAFRGTPLRVSTANVALTRLGDGTELIRIGAALRPELAAWRYGPRFATRYRRYVAIGAAGVSLSVGYLIAGPVLGLVAVGGAWGLPLNMFNLAMLVDRARRVVLRSSDAQGTFVATPWHLATAQVVPLADDPLGWGLNLAVQRIDAPVGSRKGAYSTSDPRVLLTGEAAIAAARIALPSVNHHGGGRASVDGAVRFLEAAGSPEQVFRTAADASRRLGLDDKASWLSRLPVETRIALEMAAHEEQERQAAEGELAELEAAWRAAEEVAAIADSLTLPDRVLTRLERLGRRV
ncbi:MAG: hypothetical protein IPJ78_09230 [Gemmatimonadetes bacterium]|nr:hypothetical protein [Gemmatimonadota bacterium]